MNVDFFIHGTPQGQDVYSTCNNKDLYVLSFYGTKYESESLVVETKVFDNKIYCYYTFYVNNIIDSQKRNAYFAITLRCDQFVKCINTIYKLLELVYVQYILGTFISCDNRRIYLINSFVPKGNDVFNKLSQLLTSTLRDTDLVKLDESFITNTNPPLLVHPSSINIKEIVSTYKKLERLVLSPFAKSDLDNKRVEEFQNKIDYLKHEYEEKHKYQVSELTSKIDKLYSKIDYLDRENHKLKDIISQKAQLEDEIVLLKSQNSKIIQENHFLQRKMSETGHERLQIKRENDSLNKIITELSNIFEGYTRKPEKVKKDRINHNKDFRNRFLLKILGVASNTICIVLLLILIVLSLRENKNTTFEVLPKNPTSSESVVCDKEDYAVSDMESTSNDEEYTRDIQHGVRIDIAEFNGKELIVGQKYHLRLFGFEMPHEVSWRILGECDYDGKDAFVVNGSSSIEIQCLFEGKIISERKVNVESKTNALNY